MDTKLAKFEAAQQILETRLTRSELVELVIGELEQDLANEIREIDAQISAENVITNDEAQQLIPQLRMSFITYTCDGKLAPRISFDASFNSKAVKLHGVLRDRFERVAALVRRKDELTVAQREFCCNKQRAKLNILKRCLESSEEGKQLLQNLDEFKASIKTKLLGG